MTIEPYGRPLAKEVIIRPHRATGTNTTMRRVRRLAAAGGIAVLAGAGAHAETLRISCGAVGIELEVCREGAQAWARSAGHEVEVVSTPNSATERLALYQQLLAARSPDLDVLQIDVVWPGLLAAHLADLRAHLEPADVAAHLPALVENDTVAGRLVAMPWFTDAGMLYYRKDLLDAYGAGPPATWDELTRTADAIMRAERAAGNDRMWGFVFQAKAYEGLTCNALEWIASRGGGTIVDAGGAVTVDNPRAAAALEMARGWVGTIAPPGVLNYAEEDARGVFQSGNAVFMRNWPYAWALGNAPDSAVKGRIGVSALPRGGAGGRHTGTLGGWQLAVSRYSEHPALAAALVRYLTGSDEQKRRAIRGAYQPTIPTLYEDADVLRANPFMGELRAIFLGAVARPSRITGRHYNRVSAAFFGEVHRVLGGEAGAGDALAALARRLRRLSSGGRW